MAERGDLGDIPEQGPWEEEEDDEPAADDAPAEEPRAIGDETA
jgi:hypothetical protein